MKKTYFYNEDTSERFALYVGIDRVYGGWIKETGGDPITLNDLEEIGSEEEIEAINATIADPSTPWESLTDEDEEYVNDYLVAWGC